MGLLKKAKCKAKVSLVGKVAVITGANTGIGYETARDLLKRGARVILANRNLELTEKAVQRLKDDVPDCQIGVVRLNLASLSSVKACAEIILQTESQIHLLINNAGVICPYEKTVDGLEMQFQTNHLGHFLLTLLLLPTIKRSAPSRIVNVASVAHILGKVNFDDLQSTKSYSTASAYYQSKLCNVLFTFELTKLLKDTGVVAYAAHPGVVATDMGRHMSAGVQQFTKSVMAKVVRTPEQGAQTSLHCALNEKLAEQHKKIYYSDCSPGFMSCKAKNEKDAQRLWTISEELVQKYL